MRDCPRAISNREETVGLEKWFLSRGIYKIGLREANRSPTFYARCWISARAAMPDRIMVVMPVGKNTPTSISQNNDTLLPTNEAVPVAPQQLTQFQESAPAVVVKPKTFEQELTKFANPYEAQDVEKVLSRVYKVRDLTWDPTDTAESNLGTVSFPEALFAIPNIAAKLEQFEWFRADVEYTIKINGTPFHIGELQVSHLTHSKSTSPVMDHMRKRSGCQNVALMSASSINSVTDTIARTGPRMYDQAHDEGVGQIGTLWVDVFFPLLTLNTATATPLIISIFARFVNIHVAGYGVTPISPLEIRQKLKRLKKLKEHTEKHSGIIKESDSKAEKNVISGVAEAMSSFAPMLAVSPLGELAPFAAAGGLIAPLLKSIGLDKPTTAAATQIAKVDTFRDMVHGHGVSNAHKMSLHPQAMVGDTDLCGMRRWQLKDIIKTPQCVFTGAIDGNTPINEPFLHFLVSPGLCYKKSDLENVGYFPTHLAYLSQMFRLWRGDLKMMIRFTTSQFTTTRVRFLHFPNAELPPDLEEYGGDAPGAVVDVRGTQEFSVPLPYLSPLPSLPIPGFYNPGDALVDQQVACPWVVPAVSLSLVNPVNVPDSDSDSTIYYSIWIAASENFDFGHFDRWQLRTTSAPAVAAKILPPRPKPNTFMDVLRKAGLTVEEEDNHSEKHAMMAAFQQPFKPVVPTTSGAEFGLVFPEKYSSINDLMHRLEPRFAGTSDNIFVGLEGVVPDSNNTVDIFKQIFHYWRGELVFKFPRPGAEHSAMQGRMTNPFTGNSENRLLLAGPTPSLDISVPWQHYSYAIPLNDSFASDALAGWTYPKLRVETTDGGVYSNCYFYRATGEDFMFGTLVPPPIITVPIGSTSKERNNTDSPKV